MSDEERNLEFDRVVETDWIIRGKVFVGAGRAPVADANVCGFGVGASQPLSVTSDDDGRYELRGLARNRESLVSVAPPPGSDLVQRTISIPAVTSETAIDADIELKRGIVIEGRLFDRTTGHGLKGSVKFVPLPGNPFAEQPGFDGHKHGENVGIADSAGHFRLVVIPGPGVLMACARVSGVRVGDHEINPYRLATFSEEDRRRVMPNDDGDGYFFTQADGSIEGLGSENSARVIDLPPDSEHVTCDVPLELGKTIDVSLEDDAGQPLSGALIAGITESWPVTLRLTEPTCTIYALGADRPRRLCILHTERRLATSMTLTGEERGPVTIRLGAAASITGRALDASGVPLADARVIINYACVNANELDRFVRLEHPIAKTDDDGRFEVGNIVPGERFTLDFKQGEVYFRASLADDERQLDIGQKRELGELEVKRLW